MDLFGSAVVEIPRRRDQTLFKAVPLNLSR